MTNLTDFRCKHYPDRPGGFMFTHTGTHYFPFDPRPEEVHLRDIAHHLSLQCRFNGACKCFYSVAEHCVHASHIVPPEHALEALLHDAAEAYLGDLIRPLKHVPELGGFYKKVEELNESVIAERYGLIWPWPDSVKKADEMMVTLEIKELITTGPHGGDYHDSSAMATIGLRCWSPILAEQAFMNRFVELNTRRRMGLDAVDALDD